MRGRDFEDRQRSKMLWLFVPIGIAVPALTFMAGRVSTVRKSESVQSSAAAEPSYPEVTKALSDTDYASWPAEKDYEPLPGFTTRLRKSREDFQRSLDPRLTTAKREALSREHTSQVRQEFEQLKVVGLFVVRDVADDRVYLSCKDGTVNFYPRGQYVAFSSIPDNALPRRLLPDNIRYESLLKGDKLLIGFTVLGLGGSGAGGAPRGIAAGDVEVHRATSAKK